VAVCPSGNGGANWPGASFNPTTKLFYVRVTDGCGIYTSYDDPLGFIANAPKSAPLPSRWFGGGKRSAQAGRDLTALLAGYKSGSFIRALDPFTGKRVWDYPAPLESHRAGVLTTAGGLAFLGSDDGLVAVDAATGKAVWHVSIGQDTASTPMTYMVGGKQYVALPGGVIGSTNGTGVIAAYRLY
jgi:alcohol dehydrogenase (cytochrome c)